LKRVKIMKLDMIELMEANAVQEIYNDLQSHGIKVWIDGGWCVDALLGKQTRPHPDLDIAVDHNQESLLKEWLAQNYYQEIHKDDSSVWNYVMTNGLNTIDVHVFKFNDKHENTYGIAYPYGSLTGQGVIAGHTVRCISPEWMFRFKTAYKPADKDLRDVQALSEKYGFSVPKTHQ
jgi:lincosamide nucleotidyltransferase A/C/D/E